MNISTDYNKNVNYLKDEIGFGKSFDVLYRELNLKGRRVSLFFLDGFVKDESLQSLIQSFCVYKEDNIAKAKTAEEIITTCISAIEVSEEEDFGNIIKALLSGQTAMFVENLDKCIMIDLRTYPARGPEEPDKEKVLRGARDGFVETIVFNSALIRRRIRDPKLRFEMVSVGRESKTDVAIAFIEDRTKPEALETVKKQLAEIEVDALTLGDQSLIECISKKTWYNPLPKVRYTERPDVTAAHILEGKIALLVDNNPSAMLLPTSVFDFLEDVDDYYSPILTGNYLRFLRNAILLMTLFITPIYLLITEYPDTLPEYHRFLLPTAPYHIPIFWQFLLLEFAIDGLRLASLNTPNSLGMSLSVVGALILGDFTIKTGWFLPQTILYMAIVALATFTQQSVELGFAIKFFRILLLILTSLLGLKGLIGGFILGIILLATTRTFTGEPYLYPLIPFNGRALMHLLFRTSIKSKKRKI
ncbi:stage V sporulation protein AF [Clostridium paraputrificum]|uniref:spore germination protein n=1 Tax=Clostridium paraputrificum TaxID=29363 RepID=UPI000D883721|nr:spore germination protein [Clostridium paraputrificum]SQB97146.1 stage V sporulation protein AF [Clostridium paraputrificum]